MTETKPWYRSRTIQSAIAAFVTILAQMLAYPPSEVIDALLSVAALAFCTVTVLGRLEAERKIT